MLKIIVLLGMAFLLFAAAPAPSQAQASSSPATLEQMKKLNFLVGSWEGEGWMSYGPGQQSTFTSREIVERKLDGEVLLIEGFHYNGEVTVHHALAMMSYDAEAGQYHFRSYVTGRGDGNFEASVPEEGVMQWGMDIPQGQIRYTITLNEAGQWHEIGEMLQDGETWRQFFEMTLSRVDSDTSSE